MKTIIWVILTGLTHLLLHACYTGDSDDTIKHLLILGGIDIACALFFKNSFLARSIIFGLIIITIILDNADFRSKEQKERDAIHKAQMEMDQRLKKAEHESKIERAKKEATAAYKKCLANYGDYDEAEEVFHEVYKNTLIEDKYMSEYTISEAKWMAHDLTMEQPGYYKSKRVTDAIDRFEEAERKSKLKQAQRDYEYACKRLNDRQSTYDVYTNHGTDFSSSLVSSAETNLRIAEKRKDEAFAKLMVESNK